MLTKREWLRIIIFAGSRNSKNILPNCVRVARQTLTLFVWVQILVPQPEKKHLYKASAFFQRNLPLRDKWKDCAVKCTCGAWNIRFADVKRQISYHRERSSLFHNLRQANYFTLSKSEIFHYIIMNVCIDKIIFCIYNERESQALERLFKGFFLVFLSCFQQ